jgi:hypothetical protein
VADWPEDGSAVQGCARDPRLVRRDLEGLRVDSEADALAVYGVRPTVAWQLLVRTSGSTRRDYTYIDDIVQGDERVELVLEPCDKPDSRCAARLPMRRVAEVDPPTADDE